MYKVEGGLQPGIERLLHKFLGRDPYIYFWYMLCYMDNRCSIDIQVYNLHTDFQYNLAGTYMNLHDFFHDIEHLVHKVMVNMETHFQPHYQLESDMLILDGEKEKK